MIVQNQYGCIMADGMGLGEAFPLVSFVLYSWSPRQNSADDCPDMDTSQAISAFEPTYYREMYHRMS